MRRVRGLCYGARLAGKLLAQAQQELMRRENYATDAGLMAQLREEAGIAPKEVVPETEKTTTPEKDKDVDTFLKRFAPQMDAIIAKNRIAARGNQYDDDLKSIAMIAAAKAYEEFDPAKGASIDTAASTYVEKAIIDFNRKQHREFKESGGHISLDQTNEQGEALSEVVADENASAVKQEQSKDPIGDFRKWKSTLKTKDQKILDMMEQGVPPSVIARAEGIGMTTDEVKTRLRELEAAARIDGELLFRKKREQSGEKVEDVNYRKKRLHRQVNPMVRDGKVKDEYADLLANKKYTPTTIKELQDKALDWILRQGRMQTALAV